MAEDIQTKRGNIEKMKKYLQDCDDYINAMKVWLISLLYYFMFEKIAA